MVGKIDKWRLKAPKKASDLLARLSIVINIALGCRSQFYELRVDTLIKSAGETESVWKDAYSHSCRFIRLLLISSLVDIARIINIRLW